MEVLDRLLDGRLRVLLDDGRCLTVNEADIRDQDVRWTISFLARSPRAGFLYVGWAASEEITLMSVRDLSKQDITWETFPGVKLEHKELQAVQQLYRWRLKLE